LGREEGLENPYYRRMMGGPVGRFGQYLMSRAYEPGILGARAPLYGSRVSSRREQELRARLARLTADERDAAFEVARSAVIGALHGFLHGVSHDEATIQLRYEGHDLSELSDGLHGDLFWWLRDLTEHPYDTESHLDLP
jgi:hypothetical protein